MRVRFRLATCVLSAILACAALPVGAEEPSAEKAVCGRDLMSAEELAAHREKMRGLATREERAAYRAEHHAKMVERAKQRGVELSPEGCPRGRGMGGPGGRGPGPGPGPAPAPKQP